MLFHDYDTLYAYQSAELKSQVSADQFIRFMEQEDTEADFKEFEIDSVVIQGDIGRVRLKFTGAFWFFREKRNVTSTWVREGGNWYIQKDPQGRFWARFVEWQIAQRLRRLPEISRELHRVARLVEGYFERYNAYPTALEQLGNPTGFADPNGEGEPLRYFSDGKTFWILAANGPDGKPDLDVTQYRGDITRFPPQELLYDPITGQGDLFQYGPKDALFE